MGDPSDSDGSSADSALTFDDNPADYDPAESGSADSDCMAVVWPPIRCVEQAVDRAAFSHRR